jgi:hypothetical protein
MSMSDNFNLRSFAADAARVATKYPPIVGSFRQIVAAAHIGACLIFLATILGLQRLDAPLSVASIAFMGALPLIGLAFAIFSFKVDSTPDVRPVLSVREAVMIVVSVLENVGLIAVWAGVIAVAWHFGFAALIAAAGALLIVLLAFSGVALVIARQSKRAAQPGKE